GWRGHDPVLWQEVLAAAKSRVLAEVSSVSIRGQDRDAAVIRSARANADRAGVGKLVAFELRSLEEAAPDPGAGDTGGLVCVN
ncbi:hypothetical protein ABTH90_17765, partial [Acinetobacter baumannii]